MPDTAPPVDDAERWFIKKIPKEWFSTLEILTDRDEILVIGTLPDEDSDGEADDRDAIDEFREDTRDDRIAIATKAEKRFCRKVSWAVASGETRLLFTHLSVPVMTRLRLPERSILDTLVGAGVARSRSDAVAWCVRLVAEHEADWLGELQDAIGEVERVRNQRHR